MELVDGLYDICLISLALARTVLAHWGGQKD